MCHLYKYLCIEVENSPSQEGQNPDDCVCYIINTCHVIWLFRLSSKIISKGNGISHIFNCSPKFSTNNAAHSLLPKTSRECVLIFAGS